jgi:hypothetical protein
MPCPQKLQPYYKNMHINHPTMYMHFKCMEPKPFGFKVFNLEATSFGINLKYKKTSKRRTL